MNSPQIADTVFSLAKGFLTPPRVSCQRKMGNFGIKFNHAVSLHASIL